MSFHSELDRIRQNCLTANTCPRPTAADRITVALDHLEWFIKPSVDDPLSYQFIVQQLRTAVRMIDQQEHMR